MDLWPLEDRYWIFRGKIDHVVDGDTYDVVLDCGFRTYNQVRVRLYGVDTAEIYGVKHESDEYERGQTHKDAAGRWFTAVNRAPWPLLISTAEDTGKYGRWPALIRARGGHPETVSLRDRLLEEFPEVDNLESV